MAGREITRAREMPQGPHWGIMTFGETTTSSDMGHGYGVVVETHRCVTYQAYEDRAEWEAECKSLCLGRQDFAAFHVDGKAKFVTEVKLEI